jgi:hypothetical protein
MLMGADTPATPSYSSSSFDRVQKPAEETKPAAQSWDKVSTSSYTSPFDDAQKLIDAAPAVHMFEPKAEAETEMPASSSFHFEAPSTSSADDELMSAFSEPTPTKTGAAAAPVRASQPDWQAAVGSSSEPAKVAAETPKKEEDSIARMRRLFKENSLLQKNKKGHMVSVKLHRGW